MKKRMIAILMVFVVLYASAGFRLYTLTATGFGVANNTGRRYTIEINEIRGDILDCNGEKLVSADYENVVVLKPTYKALTTVKNALDTSEFELLQERMKSAGGMSVNIGKFEVDENSDVVMLRKYLRYSDNQLANHIIGYLNGEGKGVYGIEKSFDKVLYTGKSLSASFMSDIYGRVLSGTEIQINNKDMARGSVELTLDIRMQKIVEDALDSDGVECGGAIVVETNTGAIKAIASRPDFDVKNIVEDLEDERSPLFNRTLNAFSVGSVFKVVVAAAALENGEENFVYNCKGSCDVDGTVFNCNNKTAHGKLDITKALECSCNTFFIELAKMVGADKIRETASLMGFGQQTELAEGLVSKAGTLPDLSELENSGNFANFSFGQGRFTATMLQLSNMMSAVAGRGRYHKPYLVSKIETTDGETSVPHSADYPVYVLTEKTCNKLTQMLISVIENGNAQKAKPESGIKAAGKTATAQTGIFDKNGAEIYNTWFAGFFPAEKPRYTVVVLKEGGSSGATDCAPVFRNIADEILRLEKNS